MRPSTPGQQIRPLINAGLQMAGANIQSINNIINQVRLGQYVDVMIPNPDVSANSLGRLEKLATNTEKLVFNFAEFNPDNRAKVSKFKVFILPQQGVKTKNKTADSVERIKALLNAGYVFITPIDYFVLPDHLSLLLAAHAKKAGNASTRQWLIDLLSRVNFNLLERNPASLVIAKGDTDATFQAAVDAIVRMSGPQVGKVTPEQMANRSFQNVTNILGFLGARDAPIVRKSKANLTPEERDKLEVFHPSSGNRAKTLVEKLREKVDQINKAISLANGFTRNYHIKINTTVSNGAVNYSVNHDESTSTRGPTIGGKMTKAGNQRWTVQLSNVGGNNIYLTVGADLANNVSELNLLSSQVGGIFGNLANAFAQVKQQAQLAPIQPAVAVYSQPPAQIAADNRLDQLDAAQSLVPGQFVPGQSIQLPPPVQPDLQSIPVQQFDQFQGGFQPAPIDQFQGGFQPASNQDDLGVQFDNPFEGGSNSNTDFSSMPEGGPSENPLDLGLDGGESLGFNQGNSPLGFGSQPGSQGNSPGFGFGSQPGSQGNSPLGFGGGNSSDF